MTDTPSAHVQVLPPDLSGYVSRDEMTAHLDPMKEDIAEIKGDVKTLLAANAGRSALSGLARHVSVLGATVASGVVGGVLALLVH